MATPALVLQSADPSGRLESLIESLDLTPLQQEFLKARWLDQLRWVDRQARRTRNLYYTLRLTAVIGGVLLPAMLSAYLLFNQAGEVRFLAFAVSLVVAVSGAVEEFFHYGERWRQYRGTAELLMTEGWRFLQLSNDYAHFASQTEGYKLFAGRVEAILEQDMHSYLTKVAGAKEDRTRPAAARAK